MTMFTLIKSFPTSWGTVSFLAKQADKQARKAKGDEGKSGVHQVSQPEPAKFPLCEKYEMNYHTPSSTFYQIDAEQVEQALAKAINTCPADCVVASALNGVIKQREKKIASLEAENENLRAGNKTCQKNYNEVFKKNKKLSDELVHTKHMLSMYKSLMDNWRKIALRNKEKLIRLENIMEEKDLIIESNWDKIKKFEQIKGEM